METTMRFVDPAEITQPSSQVSQNQLNAQPARSNGSPQNPLSMEEFSDLTVLLSAAASNVDTACSTDEQLSTPVFDKEAFDYNPNGKVKFELNETRSPFLCDSQGLVVKQQSSRNIHNNHNTISTSSGDDTDVFLYQPEARLFPSLCKDSPNDQLLDQRYLDEEEEKEGLRPFGTNLDSISNNIKCHHSLEKSPQEDDRYSCVSSPANDFLLAVPEHYDHSYDAKPMLLNLMSEYFKFPVKEEASSTLNTPDVIDDAVDLESDFNILNIISNGELSFIDAGEELFQSLTSPTDTTTNTTLSSEPTTPSSVISPESSNQPQESSDAPEQRQSRRRKRSYQQIIDDDDDEDYVPPAPTRRRISTLEDSTSSNDSFLQPPRRGRPPKRAADAASPSAINEETGGGVGGESKYRELRDKNNEASRKSRLKRKIKEQEYEKEADDLYRANIRLKAQVEQLEETVASFRNNLFKMLVPK